MTEWRLNTLLDAPWLNTVQKQVLGRFPMHGWPQLQHFNQALSQDHRSGSGQLLRFVAQNSRMGALAYEQAIYDTGQVPTRTNNWHDLFNALMWITWPRTKAALNGAHVADKSQAQGRSRRRDLLTLLDECTVVVANSDGHVPQLHRAHRWHALFVERRQQWHHHIHPLLLGHGLAQQMLKPYMGLTGKAWYQTVPETFPTWTPQRQHQYLDQSLAEQLQHNPNLSSPRSLLPMPVLGVPAWYSANQDAAFYRQRRYFRPRAAEQAQPYALVAQQD